MSFITDIFGAKQAAKGQQKAADAASKAAAESLALQERQYNQTREDNQPWMSTGRNALATLAQVSGQNGPALGYNWNKYLADNTDVADAINNGYFGGVNGPGGVQGAAQRHYEEYGHTADRFTPTRATNMDAFTASPDYQFRMNEGARALTARNSALGIQDSGAAQKSALQYNQNLAAGEFGDWWNRQAGLAGVGQTAAGANQSAGQNYANVGTNINQNKANALGSSYINQGNIWGNLITGLGNKAETNVARMFGMG